MSQTPAMTNAPTNFLFVSFSCSPVLLHQFSFSVGFPRDATSHGKTNPGFFSSPAEGSAFGIGEAGNATWERGSFWRAGGQSLGSGSEHDVRGCAVIRGKRRPGDAIPGVSSSSNSQPLSSCWTTTAESRTMLLRFQFE